MLFGVENMISISGDKLNDWVEYGVENKDRPLSVNCCGYQKLITRTLTRNRTREDWTIN